MSTKEYYRKYREANKELIAKKAKEYREANKAKIAEHTKANKDKKKAYDELHRLNKKTEIAEQRKTFREANKAKIAEQDKKYREANKAKILERNKLYYEHNKDKIKQYREVNKDKINQQNREYIKKRKKNDIQFKINQNIRSLISMTIKNKGFKKSLKSEQILGCTIQEFKQHLEGLFESWMSWDNYGNPKDGLFEPNKTWDIDHIIPASSGLTDEELVKLNHYKNLKPLCSYVNRWVKKNKPV